MAAGVIPLHVTQQAPPGKTNRPESNISKADHNNRKVDFHHERVAHDQRRLARSKDGVELFLVREPAAASVADRIDNAARRTRGPRRRRESARAPSLGRGAARPQAAASLRPVSRPQAAAMRTLLSRPPRGLYI